VSREEAPAAELRFQGIPVCPGIARARVVIHLQEEEDIPSHSISNDAVPSEIARFESALIATRAELLALQQKIAQALGASDASIFDAHLLVVEDRTLIDEVLKAVTVEHLNVEFAFQSVADRYCRSLEAIDDPYLSERVVDIQDVARRVIRNLLGKQEANLVTHGEPHLLIAHNLTPSDTALIDRNLVLGFATEVGSKTSHTAIMARSMDIPAIVGLSRLCEKITSGAPALIDGYRGIFIINPSDETLAEYDLFEQEKDLVEEKLELIRDTESTTSDGCHIILSANIELPTEMDDVDESGADGVGLFRTEFLFLNRDTLPTEDEQFDAYRTVAERCGEASVIIRTLDIGGDKEVAGLDLPHEENPFLGCRAIRFCLANPEIFKTQLRAILRSSVHGNVKIMYPMVSGLGEVRQANRILGACKSELRAEGSAFNENVEVGVMIEVPSAAICADLIAKEVSFLSIGTNDLIQYTIAVDRLNERITDLYKPTHPAIIRLISSVIGAGHNAGIWVGVCGEMASDIVLTPLLIGLGIDELSTSPTMVPRVKRAVQCLDLPACRELARQALLENQTSEILRRCTELANARYGELV
jgi:phosphotransferase system enzyme I (PtsI)